MVRIRMQRLGRTHRPFYRINAIDIRTARNGKVIENLGWYNPMAPEGEDQIQLKEDRIRDWMSRGARPSETVLDMLGHRDLLTDKQKAEWEAERAKSRLRVECKQSVAKAEAALKEIEAMVKSSGDDSNPAVETAKAAVETCKRAVSGGRVARAEAAAAEAQAALESLKKAGDEAKAKAEAAAAAEAAAEGGEETSEESAEG